MVTALSAAALRRDLEDRGELPDAPLVAMVPVSVRSESQKHEFTNRVTSILGELEPAVQRRHLGLFPEALEELEERSPQ